MGQNGGFPVKMAKLFSTFFYAAISCRATYCDTFGKLFSRFLGIVKRFTTRKAPKIGFSMIPKKQRIRLVVCRLRIIMQPNTNATIYNYYLCYPLTANT